MNTAQKVTTVNRAKLLKNWFVNGFDEENRVPVRFLGNLLRTHWRYGVLAFGFSLFVALFESGTIGLIVLALESLSGQVTSQASSSFDFLLPMLEPIKAQLGQDGYFLSLIVLAVIAQILVSGSEFSGRAFGVLLQAMVERDVRQRVFRQFMKFSYAQVRKYKVGDLASYNEQVVWIGQTIQIGNYVLGNLVMLLAYTILLFWLSWPMTLTAVVVFTFISLGLSRLINQIRRYGRDYKDANTSLNETTVEFLSGLRVIKSFGREVYAISNVDKVIAFVYDARRKALVRQMAIGPIIDVVAIIGVAGFLGVGYLILYDGNLDVLPRLLTFIFILYRLMPRVKSVNDRIGYLNNYWAFVKRIGDFLNKEDKEFSRKGTKALAALREGIEFQSVSLRYGEAEKWALDGISFEIPKGSMVALVGESGAGKSTIADLVIGMYRPTNGHILVDDINLLDVSWDDWRERIGVVDQEAFIFHDTVRENIAFGNLEATDEEIVAAAKAANAHEFIVEMKDGYGTVVGDRGFRLSGGQRQRISIARAILRNPDLLVLDEATSDLDSLSERLIQEAIDNLRQDRTILIIAHRLSTIVNADKILVLADGRLLEEGSHEALLERNGAYTKFWEIQAAT